LTCALGTKRVFTSREGQERIPTGISDESIGPRAGI
jgi:hypothetical protein